MIGAIFVDISTDKLVPTLFTISVMEVILKNSDAVNDEIFVKIGTLAFRKITQSSGTYTIWVLIPGKVRSHEISLVSLKNGVFRTIIGNDL